METPSVLTNKSSSINNVTSVHEENKNPKINQEKSTSTIKESHATKTPYRHPNYKGHHIMHQDSQRQNQHEKISKDPVILKKSSSVESNHFQNHRSCCHTILQKIELGWSDPFTTRQFYSTLHHSYRRVSSILTTSRTKNHVKT
jgi:hypothetical protein